MEQSVDQLISLVNQTYIQQGLNELQSRNNLINLLLTTKQLPLNGWDDMTIEYFMNQLALMDSNNFHHNIGIGEREGRIYSTLIQRRHYSLSHGIGRSGNITEVQPKATGSSLIYQLTNLLVQHAIEFLGLKTLKKSLVVPLATGMTLTLCLLTIKQLRPQAKYVLWSRIDQKSCFKCILTAGLQPIIIPTQLNGDEVGINMSKLREILSTMESLDEILCILTTTSCFAPRRPDCIDLISQLCQEYSLPHVINNAYGLQCPVIIKLINRSVTIGRIDYLIQSTDKNFLVPVGGAIISSPTPSLIDQVAKLYPGRASSSPIVDLFITLLSTGQSGLERIHNERLRCLPILIDGLENLTKRYQERVLISPRNTISIGITLTNLHKSPTFLGSMLFQRSISGCRVVSPSAASSSSSSEPTTINGYQFHGWGSHHDAYPTAYLTAACAIGIQDSEIYEFLSKLEKVLKSTKTITNIPIEVMVMSETTAEKGEEGEKGEKGEEKGEVEVNSSPLSLVWSEMIARKAKHIG